MWWIPAVSVRLPAQCVVPCASLRFIQGHVGGFTDIFFFFILFFGGGGENLWSLHLYLLEIFFAISDCVLCKGVKASSEQGTDHFQIFLPQGYRDNKILLGVLKSLSLLFQGDLLWTTQNAIRTALLPGLLMSWQSHQNIDLLHPYVRWKVWYSPGGGKKNQRNKRPVDSTSFTYWNENSMSDFGAKTQGTPLSSSVLKWSSSLSELLSSLRFHQLFIVTCGIGALARLYILVN